MSAERDIKGLHAIAASGLQGPAAHGQIRLAQPVGLARGRVHEVLGDGGDAFALMAAACTAGPVLWIGLARDIECLAPTGLQRFLDPARFVVVVGGDRDELLWAAEQALRARSAPCVILELKDGPDLKESRRFQIAAEDSGAIGIVLIQRRAQTSAAETRWQCDAAGDAWEWRCTKSKRGLTGAWRVSWRGNKHAPDLVALAASASA